jgi:hypothetical protein
MGRQIDFDKPLSDENKAWLRDRSRGYEVDDNERRFSDDPDAPVVPDTDWTPSNRMAAEPFDEPGANPRQVPFPVGVDGEHVDRSAGGYDDQTEEVAVEDLNVEELKAELHERDLPVGGNKEELVKRLKKALKDEGK